MLLSDSIQNSLVTKKNRMEKYVFFAQQSDTDTSNPILCKSIPNFSLGMPKTRVL